MGERGIPRPSSRQRTGPAARHTPTPGAVPPPRCRALLNDSYLTKAHLLHAPHDVAVACMLCAARAHARDVGPWLERADIDHVSVGLAVLNAGPLHARDPAVGAGRDAVLARRSGPAGSGAAFPAAAAASPRCSAATRPARTPQVYRAAETVVQGLQGSDSYRAGGVDHDMCRRYLALLDPLQPPTCT